jgi:hypothetical protein
MVHERRGGSMIVEDRAASPGYRHGDGASRIVDVKLFNSRGEAAIDVQSGERISARVTAAFQRDSEHPVVGLLIRNRLGIDVYGTNTRIEQNDLGLVRAGERVEVDFVFDCLLTAGEYTLTVATQHWDGTSQDWRDDHLSFTVHDTRGLAGLADLRTKVEWRRS